MRRILLLAGLLGFLLAELGCGDGTPTDPIKDTRTYNNARVPAPKKM
jgi:hypothetical protein